MRAYAELLTGLGLALAMMLTAPAWAEETGAPQRSTLTIETKRAYKYEFDVELALTDEQRIRGLMFRESLAPNAGMLFVFDDVAPRAFWMKNTLIPLDMLFIAADGTIINIAKRAEPHDTTIGRYVSAAPAKAVLEINGGMSDLLGITPGDRVVHPLITPEAAAGQ